MDLGKIKVTPEFMEKLDEVESFEDLKKLAQESGIVVTDEELAQYFDEENQVIKLVDDDLEKVAGGGGKCGSHIARPSGC